MISLGFRRAREPDLDRLVEIHSGAFPDPRGYEARCRNFTENVYGSFENLWIAEADGQPVAHAFLFPLSLSVGGNQVQAGGIASVGVAPEARGTGVAARLLEHLHAEADARGDAVTVLYAFRQAFYARHGYASVSPYKRLRFNPLAVPRTWRGEGDALRARPARGDDWQALSTLHRQVAKSHTGWIARTERVWGVRLLDEGRRWFVVEERGVVTGYMAWSLVQTEAHARITLLVRELVAGNERAKRHLYALAGAQRDQVEVIEIDVRADDPVDHALFDMDLGRYGTEDTDHVLGEIVAGPMVRIVDVPRALEARGYEGADEGEAALTLDVRDPAEAFAVTLKGGRAAVRPGDSSGAALRLDRATLGAIVYGGLAVSDAARLGWFETQAGDANTVALAERVFRIPPYFSYDPF